MARFDAALVAVAGLLAETRDDWWLIGSAAARLHGTGGAPPADIDVLVSLADGHRLRDRLTGVTSSPDSHARFRSTLFGGWSGAPLPVEVMADLRIRRGETWEPVRLATREARAVVGVTLWVPERAELIALFERFGRPKDRARAAALALLTQRCGASTG